MIAIIEHNAEEIMNEPYKISVSLEDFKLFNEPMPVVDSFGTTLNPSDYDILFIPYNTWHKKIGPFFAKEVWPFLDFIKAQLPDVEVDVFIGQEDYKELALHGAFKNFGKVFVNLNRNKTKVIGALSLGVLTNLISDYVEGSINPGKTEIRITIQTQIHGKDFSVSYEGPSSEFSKQIIPIINEIEETPISDIETTLKKFSKNECNSDDN